MGRLPCFKRCRELTRRLLHGGDSQPSKRSGANVAARGTPGSLAAGQGYPASGNPPAGKKEPLRPPGPPRRESPQDRVLRSLRSLAAEGRGGQRAEIAPQRHPRLPRKLGWQ